MLDTASLRIALGRATDDLKGQRTVGAQAINPINEAARYVAQNLHERYVLHRREMELSKCGRGEADRRQRGD